MSQVGAKEVPGPNGEMGKYVVIHLHLGRTRDLGSLTPEEQRVFNAFKNMSQRTILLNDRKIYCGAHLDQVLSDEEHAKEHGRSGLLAYEDRAGHYVD